MGARCPAQGGAGPDRLRSKRKHSRSCFHRALIRKAIRSVAWTSSPSMDCSEPGSVRTCVHFWQEGKKTRAGITRPLRASL